MGSDGSEERPERRFRTLFISDVHLGARGSQADRLLDFLRTHDAETIYLVGDIVDGWRLQKKWFWPDKHAEILARLMARARNGTEVVYLPGNHDEVLRRLIGRSVSGVKIRHDTIHHTADGRRLLVVHGDVFDGVVTEMRWLALIGSVAYEFALTVNTWFNAARRWLGLGYWPLSAFLKERVKAAVNFIDRYEHSLAHEARRRSVCGVICGHVHKPEMRTIDGVLYYNDGDWVESCSALVEHKDGRLELLAWAQRPQRDLLPSRRPTAAESAARTPATT